MAAEIPILQAAFSGLSTVVVGIERIAAYRAEKKRQRAMRMQGQQNFLHAFSYAGAPDDDTTEDETIRSYCKKLQNVIRSHWGFIFGKGQHNTEAAHAFMASTLFHVAAMPGIPPPPKPAVTGHPVREVILIFRYFDANISKCHYEAFGRPPHTRECRRLQNHRTQLYHQ